MAKLSGEQYAKKLQKHMKILQEGKPLQIAAYTVHADRIERIFDTGSVAKGYNKIKEVWIDNNLVRGGATNSGKTGRAKKTSYFKSYFDAKGQMGFENSHVNFRLSNDLQRDFANTSIDTGTGTPDSGAPIKVNNMLWIEALRRSENIGKLDGLKSKYGDFTKFTSKERKKFIDIMQGETIKLLRAA